MPYTQPTAISTTMSLFIGTLHGGGQHGGGGGGGAWEKATDDTVIPITNKDIFKDLLFIIIEIS